MDTLKQGFSANLIHFWNIFASVLISRGTINFRDLNDPNATVTEVEVSVDARGNFVVNQDDPLASRDECAFYFLTFFLDTTVGVLISLGILHATISLASSGWVYESWGHPGYYGRANVRLKNFGEQLLQWCLVTILMKVVIAVVVALFSNEFASLGQTIFSPLLDHPRVELVLVMLVGPVIMNSFQFWMNDTILMSSRFKNRRYTYENLAEKSYGEAEDAFGEVVLPEGLEEHDDMFDVSINM
jgi:hypothetical protein